MQDALALDALDGLALPGAAQPRPRRRRRTTSVVVQYDGDGIADPHDIYRQLDEVKHQYGCFFATYFADGVPTVVAPAGLDAPCE